MGVEVHAIHPEERLPYCVLLTCPAPSGEYRKEMSDRIPVCISETLIEDWISPDTNPREIFAHRVTDFVYDEEYVRPEGTQIQWYTP